MSITREQILNLGASLLRTGNVDASVKPLLDFAKDQDPLAAYFVGRWLCKGDSVRDRAAGVRYLIGSARRGFLTSLIFSQAFFDQQNRKIDLLSHFYPDSELTYFGIEREQLPERWDERLSTFISRIAFLRAAVDAGATSALVRLAIEYVNHSSSPVRTYLQYTAKPPYVRYVSFDKADPLSPLLIATKPRVPAQTLIPQELAISLAFTALYRFYKAKPDGPADELIENSAIADGLSGRADLLARAHLALIIESVHKVAEAIGCTQTIASSRYSELLTHAKTIASDLTSNLPRFFRAPLSHDDISTLILSTREECSFLPEASSQPIFSLVEEPNLSIFEDHIIASVLSVTFRISSYEACYKLVPPWRGLFVDASRQQLLSSRYKRVLKGTMGPVGHFTEEVGNSDVGRMSSASWKRSSFISLYGPLCNYQVSETRRSETFGSAAIYGSPFNIPGSTRSSTEVNYDFGFWYIDDLQTINWVWFLRSYESSAARVPTRSPGQMPLPVFEEQVKSRPLGVGLLSDMQKKVSESARCETLEAVDSKFVKTLSEVRFMSVIDFERRHSLLR